MTETERTTRDDEVERTGAASVEIDAQVDSSEMLAAFVTNATRRLLDECAALGRTAKVLLDQLFSRCSRCHLERPNPDRLNPRMCDECNDALFWRSTFWVLYGAVILSLLAVAL